MKCASDWASPHNRTLYIHMSTIPSGQSSENLYAYCSDVIGLETLLDFPSRGKMFFWTSLMVTKLSFEGEFDFWKWYNVFRVNIWSTQNPVPQLVVGEMAFLLLFTLSLKSLFEEKQFQKCLRKWPHFPCVPIWTHIYLRWLWLPKLLQVMEVGLLHH